MAGVAMVAQVKDLLSPYSLFDKLIAYVKDKNGNLSTLTRALNFVVTCAPLGFATPWQGSCFGQAFNKTCQHAYNDANVCLGFWEVSLKATQFALQKIIMQTKNFSKGHNEWKWACIDARFNHQKQKTLVKTRFASKVILFQETLEYRNAINLCYGKQEILELQDRVLVHKHVQFTKQYVKLCFML